MPAKTKRRKKQIASKRRVIQPKKFVSHQGATVKTNHSRAAKPPAASQTRATSDKVYFKKDFSRSIILTIILLIGIITLYELDQRSVITIADLITISAQ